MESVKLSLQFPSSTEQQKDRQTFNFSSSHIHFPSIFSAKKNNYQPKKKA